MGLPNQPVTMSPEQVAELNSKLSDLRHNINNQLALVVAAAELLRRKPDLAARMVDTMIEQPQKIIEEIRKFSSDFEQLMQITRE